MSNSAILPVPSSANELRAPLKGVQRIPFYLESQGRSLFAWLHRREQASLSAPGVVICPPIGHEQIHAHRGLRHLAEALAGAGFSVLRFDYHGTGDSDGSGEEPDRVAAWLANIRDARAWLGAHLGGAGVSLIGLRLGATLAVQAAADQAVDGLLLWAPVVKGRSYVREMKALSLTSAAGPPFSAEAPSDIEAAGFVLTNQTAQKLSRLDLLQSRPLCRRTLILTSGDAPADAALREHFQNLGIETDQTSAPGYADMMAEPHYNKPPHEAIARAVDWLLAGTVLEHRPFEAEDVIAASRAAVPSAHSADCTGHSQHRIRERVLTISQEPNLFGVVSEPLDAVPNRTPLLLMVNAGSSYRVGPNRLYVALARQLAAQGFRCLRMDLCGLGDSVTRSAERENDPYPATAFRDVGFTLDHLRTRLGVQRVVLMGLCSGAYVAFQAAAQLADPVLVESLLINPLTFFWRDGMSLEAAPALQIQSFQECMRSVWQPGKWLKLLSGRSKMGLAGAVRTLLDRWRLRELSRSNASVSGQEAAPARSPSHPLQEDLSGDLERIAKANRFLACFFARSDPGYELMMLHARRKVNQLLRAGSMSLDWIDDADHTFSRRAARRALGQAITEHLCGRYLRFAE